MGGVQTMCRTFNIYVGRKMRNMWLDKIVCTFVIQHTEVSYLLYFVTRIRGYSVWKIHEKEFSYFLFTSILHWIKHEDFVMQLKKQSVVAWQNEKHYSKKIIRRETFKSVDHVKYGGQVRSGQNICCLCSFLTELSNCRVTCENYGKASVIF